MPEEVAQLIEAFLPLYQENRSRWPLWTLGPEAWRYSGEPLFEVFRWTAAYLYRDGFREYALHARWGGDNLAGAVEDLAPARLAHLAAIAASQAIDVPSRLVDVFLVDDRGSLGIPPELEEELEIGVRSALWEMFPKFLQAYEDAAFTKKQREELGIENPPRPRDLGLDFCKRAHLLISRQRGTKIGLSDSTLLSLKKEMDAIVSALYTYSPPAETVGFAQDVLLLDTALTEYSREKVRRLPERYVFPLLRRMRFPFLTSSEISTILEMQDRPVEGGLEVLSIRLPGRVDLETIRNRVLALETRIARHK